MAYYTEAALVLTKEASKSLIPNPFFTEPTNERIGLVVYLYSGYGWIDIGDEVKSIKDYCASLKSTDYCLVVVGEAVGDFEMDGSPDLQGEFTLFPHWGLDTSEVGKLTGSNPGLFDLKTDLLKAKFGVQAAIDEFNVTSQKLFRELVVQKLEEYNSIVQGQSVVLSPAPYTNALNLEYMYYPEKFEYPKFEAIDKLNELL